MQLLTVLLSFFFIGMSGCISTLCDKKELMTPVRKNMSNIRRCYETASKKKPNLSGPLLLRWNVNQNGKVKKTRIAKGSIKNKGLRKCVRSELNRWDFCSPEETVKFKFDLELSQWPERGGVRIHFVTLSFSRLILQK